MYRKIGILCAGDRELAPFLPHLEHAQTSEKALLKFYEGTLCGLPAVLLYSGVCKVNAAIAAQLLIDTYRADAVINAGTAGGMDPSLKIFDTAVSTADAVFLRNGSRRLCRRLPSALASSLEGSKLLIKN